MVTETKKTWKNKLLIGMVLASFMTSVGLCVYEYKNPVKEIVTVDVKHLVNGITKGVVEQLPKEASDDEVKDTTHASLNKLDSLLERIAADQKVIIVPKAAVVAGAKDITNEVIDLYGGGYEK